MECKCSIGIHKLYVSVTSSPPRAGQSCFRGWSCRSDSLGPCTSPWLRISPSFRLLRAITKSCVSTTFRGVYANVRRRLCPRNLTSVTCQNVPGPPPAFPIVWEVGPGNEARRIITREQPGPIVGASWSSSPSTIPVVTWSEPIRTGLHTSLMNLYGVLQREVNLDSSDIE